MSLRLSPSKLADYENCPRLYEIKHVLKVRQKETSANLPFGSAAHTAFEASVRAHHAGEPDKLNVEDVFNKAWRAEILRTKLIKYSSRWDEQSLLATGRAIVTRFHQLWPKFGLTPLVDDQNVPQLEIMLACEIEPGVLLRGKLDFIGYDQMGRLTVVDFKTPASATPEGFSDLDDQLTAYQLLVLHNAETLGVSDVGQLGFLECLKRKVSTSGRGKGPEVRAPGLVPARSEEDLVAFVEKVKFNAQCIREGRFYRRPRMAYNTPCGLCDFQELCRTGEAENAASERFGFAPSNVEDTEPDTPAVAVNGHGGGWFVI